MGPIVLLKNFTLAISPGQSFQTDWVSFPSGHKNADLHVHTQTIAPTGLGTGFSVGLETSYDTVEHTSAGAGANVNAPGSTTDNITSGLGPMARLEFQNGEAQAIFAIVSVWLQPKSD